MIKLSAVIITFNEERNIARCIDSLLAVADEIVVVDSFSIDQTKKICLGKGIRFIEHHFEGHIQQKNFALSQATHDHILSLDADEYLSSTLTTSILDAKKKWIGPAYLMNRLSSYGDKWIKNGNWYPDRKIRLWDRRLGRWGGENPHDKVILEKSVKIIHLEGDLMHTAYKDSKEALVKIQQYSSIFASENVGKKKTSTLKILGHSLFSFFKSLIIKRGILDGFEGLMVAAAESNHVFYKYSKLYEANQRASIGKKIIISRTDNLGDVILTLPIAGYLKSVYPDSEIYFIGKKYTKSIIDQCIHIDRFLDREEILKDESILANIGADSILFIYPDRELAKVAKKFNIPKRVATAHRVFNWFYCNQLVDFSRLHSELHESQLNFKLLRPFRLSSNPSLNEITSYYGIKSTPNDFSNLIDKDKFNLIIHPKSKGSAREWGLEKFSELIKNLPKGVFKIFITGLKEEENQIKNELPGFLELEGVKNVMGKFSLEEMSAFISQTDGIIASSTGVLHLAASLNKFALGLYPPLKPIHPGRWAPVGVNASFLVLDKVCVDCTKSSYCACIKAITVNQVMNRLMTFVNQKSNFQIQQKMAVN